MKKNAFQLFLLLFSFLVINVQGQRFKKDTFSSMDSAVNIRYGEAMNIKNEMETLLLDVFMPSQDTMKKRPLVVFIHGGGFQNGNRKVGIAQRIVRELVPKGYVTASISYRLGIEAPKSDKDYAEAMYRAQQDGRSAIRFLKANANKWGIDTAQVYVCGTSAGAMTSLALAYMDEHEVPTEINRSKWGPLEGSAENREHSSKVKAVMNLWGSMIDHRWINEGDVPLYNTAGTADKTVPYDSSYAYHNFKYGPYILYHRCLEAGIPTTWRPFYGVGHTLDSKKPMLDSCFSEMADWLYTRLNTNAPAGDRGVRRWENEIERFDSLNAVERYNRKSILFIGSSYIRLWKNIREDLDYKHIIHRGFGGCNLADVAYYAKRIIYPHQPKAIFMYVGNDIVAGARDKTPLQVLELFKYVVQTIRQRYPDVPITWLGISPSEKRWTVWDKVQEANAMIKQYCAKTPGLHYVSSAEKFLGNDGKPITSLYLNDKLHYNEEGYRVWGSNIQDAVHRITNKKIK